MPDSLSPWSGNAMADAPDLVTIQDAEAPFVLTLDLGSSSARATLFDAKARPVQGMLGRKALFTEI